MNGIPLPRCFQWNDTRAFQEPRQDPFFNPKWIASLSPGLDRVREGLPWVAAVKFHNPERVESQALMKSVQPFQGCDSSLFSPRVARSSQPWAKSCNPVGIGKTNHKTPL